MKEASNSIEWVYFSNLSFAQAQNHVNNCKHFLSLVLNSCGTMSCSIISTYPGGEFASSSKSSHLLVLLNFLLLENTPSIIALVMGCGELVSRTKCVPDIVNGWLFGLSTLVCKHIRKLERMDLSKYFVPCFFCQKHTGFD